MAESSEISYSGNYPDMPEFTVPWEVKAVQIGQGNAGVSVDGSPLESEGFGECSALLIKNTRTEEVMLCHIDDADLGPKHTEKLKAIVQNFLDQKISNAEERNGLSSAATKVVNYEYPKNMNREDFEKKMRVLNGDKTLQAFYLYGDSGRMIQSRLEGSILNYLGIPIVASEKIKQKKGHWDIVYKPNDRKIYVDVRRRKKMLTFDF